MPEPKSLLSGQAPLGEGLFAILNAVARSGSLDDDGPPWIVTDQNGEHYRAMEWGHALVRSLPSHPALADSLLWYPAMSFGDTGAASAGVGAALVLHAFRRDYAPGRKATVLSVSEGPGRAAIILRNCNTQRAGV